MQKGINMAMCSVFHWSIIVPIVTSGCEVWILSSVEVEELRKLQRYIGRKCQRYHLNDPQILVLTPLQGG